MESGASRFRCLTITLVIIVLNNIILSYFYLNSSWQWSHVSRLVYSDKVVSHQGDVAIDPVMRPRIVVSKSRTNEQVQARHHCTKERNHLVYMKIHKTGSDTLSAMVRRFGYKRNLSFVLPITDRNLLGWPYPLDPGMYRPKKTDTYDILCEHTVYNDITFPALMPPDTVFTASIRLPEYHFRSSFRYFLVAEVTNIPGGKNIKKFLRDPYKWEKIYTSPSDLRNDLCVPDNVSMLHNAQAFDLGFPMGFPASQREYMDQTNNARAVLRWLETIKQRFKFMIIVEYINESLVLWRRYMCWSLPDIIYHTQNIANPPHIAKINKAVVRSIRNFSSIDFALYEHYNKTLWANIEMEGADFWDELETFNYVMSNVTKFCSGRTRKHKVLAFEKSKWHKAFTYSTKDCRLLVDKLLPELKTHYDSINKTVPDIKPTGPHC